MEWLFRSSNKFQLKLYPRQLSTREKITEDKTVFVFKIISVQYTKHYLGDTCCFLNKCDLFFPVKLMYMIH